MNTYTQFDDGVDVYGEDGWMVDRLPTVAEVLAKYPDATPDTSDGGMEAMREAPFQADTIEG